MPVTDEQFTAWMADGRNRRTLIAEVQFHDGNQIRTRYMSNTGYISHAGDTPAHTSYPKLLAGVPEWSADRSDSQNWGYLEIRNDGNDEWLLDAWGNKSIKLGLGDPSWARSDFRFAEFTTSRDGITAPDKNHFRLYFFDKGADLDKPIQSALLENGDPVPLCYGEVFNIEPAYLGEDTAGAHYQVHDSAVSSITVRSGGLSASGVVYDLANGKFTIDPAPTGKVTCDVVNSAYVTVADIVGEILTGRLGIPLGRINSASFSSFDGDIPYPIGLYIRSRQNAREVVKNLLAPFSGFCSTDISGAFHLWRDSVPTDTDTPAATIHYRGYIARNGLSLTDVDRPVRAVRIGYKKNHAIQDKDALFGGVDADSRELYSREYSIYPHVLGTLKYDGDSLEYYGQDGIHSTPIVYEADARAEAERILDDRKAAKQIFTIRAFVDAVNFQLGSIVKIVHPRFGFASGRLGRIVGIRWTPTRRRCELKVVAAYKRHEGIFTEAFVEAFV